MQKSGENTSKQILRADVLGYCMGVRRAMETAVEYLSKKEQNNDNRQICTFGPLIHNTDALKALSDRGLTILDEDKIDQINPDNPPIVIIRAHGVSPDIRNKLKDKNCLIIDATCPLVLANQQKAMEKAKQSYTVIVMGDRNHGEVTGLTGCVEYIGAKCILVENRYDAQKLPPVIGKSILICQTTVSTEEFDTVAEILKKANSEIEIYKTICAATKERQAALKELCTKVDGVLVIGGRNSANTQRLLYTASKNCKKAFLIENEKEIPEEFFTLNSVGITAGASTPDKVIEAVENKLHKYAK